MNPALLRAAQQGWPDGIDTGPSDPLELPNDQGRLHASGSYVWVQDRLVPSWLEFCFNGDASSPSITGRLEIRDGAPRIVRIAFESRDDEGEVRQGHLRAVQVDALVMLMAGFALTLDRDEAGEVVVGLSNEGEPLAVAHQTLRSVRSNRRITTALLSDVAEVYRSHLATGPTKAVREQFFVSERTAANYVQRARQAGLLPPTTPGKKRG